MGNRSVEEEKARELAQRLHETEPHWGDNGKVGECPPGCGPSPISLQIIAQALRSHGERVRREALSDAADVLEDPSAFFDGPYDRACLARFIRKLAEEARRG